MKQLFSYIFEIAIFDIHIVHILDIQTYIHTASIRCNLNLGNSTSKMKKTTILIFEYHICHYTIYHMAPRTTLPTWHMYTHLLNS